jgi:hypothetical protein
MRKGGETGRHQITNWMTSQGKEKMSLAAINWQEKIWRHTRRSHNPDFENN